MRAETTWLGGLLKHHQFQARATRKYGYSVGEVERPKASCLPPPPPALATLPWSSCERPPAINHEERITSPSRAAYGELP